MKQFGIELACFGVPPLLLAIICGIGFGQRYADAEAFVPVYLIGLIFASPR